MSELRTYIVVVHRSGQLVVAASDQFTLAPYEVVLKAGFPTIDAAFDYRDDMQHRIDQVIKRHCATCK